MLQNNGDNVNIVLCDRYYYSTIAFQSAQGLNIKEIIEKNKRFLKPTAAFVLDLPVRLALERLGIRGEAKEKFEQKEFMIKLRKNFLELRNWLDDNLVIIDASKSRDTVFESIRERVDKYLNKK